MIRKLLVITIFITPFFISSCVSDGSAPDSDEPSATAAEDTASSPPAEDPGSEPQTEDLSQELDAQNNEPQMPAEQNLENELEKNELENEVAKEPEPIPPAPEPQVESQNLEPIEEPPPAVPEKAKITAVRYLANQVGGTIIVEATGPLTYHARNEGSRFVVAIDNAEIPDKLRHPYPLRDASGAFKTLLAEQDGLGAKIIVELKSASAGQPIVQSEGNSLLVIPASSAAATENTPLAKEATPQKSDSNQPLASQSLDEFLTGNQKFYGRPISIWTKDADVRDVINMIAEESGSNIVMTDEVKGKISLKIRRIPWDQALVSVMRAKKLGYMRQGNVMRISSLTELQEEADAAAKMVESQKNLSPVRVKVIPINYANVDDLAKQIGAFLSKDGKTATDPRSNSILVTDREAVVEKVERIIKALDVQPSQVMIEGKVVEAQETFKNAIGVNWNLGGRQIALSDSGGYQGGAINLTPTLSFVNLDPKTQTPINLNFEVGTLNYIGDLNAALRLSEEDDLAKVISSPRILTLNREKAEISQAGEVISITTTTNGATNERTKAEKRTPVKLNLQVTPQITVDSSVILDLEVQRQFAGPLEDPDTKARAVNTRSAKTKLLVRNGQTAVVGGIYQNDETQTEAGVPLLRDIPVLGWLFKSRTKEKHKNELLIFLTPRIIPAQTASME